MRKSDQLMEWTHCVPTKKINTVGIQLQNNITKQLAIHRVAWALRKGRSLKMRWKGRKTYSDAINDRQMKMRWQGRQTIASCSFSVIRSKNRCSPS